MRISGFALGLVALLAARFCMGLGWAAAVLLGYVVTRLADWLYANDGNEILKSVLMLLAHPFAVSLASGHAAELARKLAEMSRARQGVNVEWVESGLTVAIFIAATMLASIIARSCNNFTLPKTIHHHASRALAVLTAAAWAILAVAGIKFAEARAVQIPMVAKLAVAVGLGLYVAFTLKREFFRKEPAQPAAGKTATKGVTASPVKALENRPDVRLKDVMGMDSAKEQLRLRLIEPILNPSMARKYGLAVGGGVLLYGPPGTGKTMLARAVAGELGLPFYAINAADIFGMYVGESEKTIRRIFEEVRKNRLSVVFIDELETIFPKRSGNIHETTRQVVSMLLQELDGLDKSKNPILLLGATNVPWLVDEAFLRPGRFDEKILVDLPDAKARQKMLEAAFGRGTIALERDLPQYMAEKTSGYSGADLNGVINRLRQMAYVRKERCYTRALADEAIKAVPASVRQEQLDELRNWQTSGQ